MRIGSKRSMNSWTTPSSRQILKRPDGRATVLTDGRQTTKMSKIKEKKNGENGEKMEKMRKGQKMKKMLSPRQPPFFGLPSKGHRRRQDTIDDEPQMKILDEKRKCSSPS